MLPRGFRQQRNGQRRRRRRHTIEKHDGDGSRIHPFRNGGEDGGTGTADDDGCGGDGTIHNIHGLLPLHNESRAGRPEEDGGILNDDDDSAKPEEGEELPKQQCCCCDHWPNCLVE